MTRSAFVRNTMDAIYNQLNIHTGIDENSVHEEHTASTISFTTFEWNNLQRSPSSSSNFSSRSSTYAQSLDSSMSSNSHIAIGSKSWQLELKNQLKQMYTNIRHCQISDPSLPPSPSGNSHRVSTVLKRSMGTIMWRGTRQFSSNSSSSNEDVDSSSSTIATSISSSCLYPNSLIQYQSLASHLQTELPMTYTSSAPYYKEGLVIRKHLLEKTNQKAKHRDWRECFMVIERSQLRMYKLDCNNNEPRKRSLIRNTLMNRQTQTQASPNECSDAVGGGDWLSSALLVGLIDLKHTLANVLPSGYSKQRQHAFALQQANGAIHLFQVGSEAQAHEWVSTCNYWAARESKEPMSGGVSSMDYGWNCLELDSETPIIHEWQAPIPPTVSSLLEESAQLEALQKHVQELSEELDQHRDIKPRMEDRFANSKLFTKVLMNWEKKSCYLLHEIIKYQNYCDSIEKSLALQTKFKSL
ncbi:Pleckstrin homology domain-containing protein [Choanephora cucurbitarum]|nr:Pleckstrin homology domain-containing protein [Choanephora cucurbitarum]